MRTRWLVDAMNVIGSRPTGWWRDRAGAIRDLVAELERFATRSGDEITVVIDGRPAADRPRPGGAAAGRLWVAYAPGGRDAADDAIAQRVARVRDPGPVRVVTSDKGLAARVQEEGAEVMAAGEFRRLLEP